MKCIFITGSTDGIGKLTALQLAQAGHEVYLHGRNADKLAAVVQELRQLSPQNQAQGFLADLSNLQAVRRLAAQVQSEVSGIDVLINNAGVFHGPPMAHNGLDLRFAVNYLAPVVLTNALLPCLRQQPQARIINLSSAAQAPISYSALRGTQSISVQAAYAQSKLALTMWNAHFAKACPDLNAIAVNPGSLLNTKMVQEAFGQYWSSADKGAHILSALATSEVYANASGKYFDNDKGDPIGSFGDPHPDALNASKIASLISETEAILAQVLPENPMP